MRNMVLFTFGMLFLGVGIAQAQGIDRDYRPAKLSCRYLLQEDCKDKTCPRICTAQALVAHYNREGINQDGRNLLSVECDGTRIYENEAQHTNFLPRGVEFLTAAGGNPGIKYPSSHPNNKVSFATSSWLNVSGYILEGSCSVEILLTN